MAELVLVYDGDCPLCSAYSRMVRLRESVGELRLVDARQDSEAMRQITRAGLDVDEGMVLKVDDVLYHGADALAALALISGGSGTLNRLNHWIFRSAPRARLLYPLLRAGRNLALRLRGRGKIDNLGRQAGPDHR